MSMEEFQPTPQQPEIRRRPPGPEISGILPPKPDKLPGEDKPELDDDDFIVPPAPVGPEVDRRELPDLDHDDDGRIDIPPGPTRH